MSRFGAATISQWMCFKTGYTEEELKATGLQQPCDDEKFYAMLKRNPYTEIKNKVETNSEPLDKKGEYPQTQRIVKIREDLARQKALEDKMNRWPGQNYEYVNNVLFDQGPMAKRRQGNNYTAQFKQP